MARIRYGAILAVMHGLMAAAANAELAPSEATTLIRQAMLHRPDAERTTLTRPIVARMSTDELSDVERFLKGEVHFLNFEPEPSRDEFWKYRNRSDNLGRVANQRLMIIRVNAFDMVDTVVNEDIPAYRERFGIRPDDRYGISYAVQRAAMRLIERGDVDAALDLVADEVRRHDRFDAPYLAYRMPGQFLEIAAKHDRGEEFRALRDHVLRGLDDVIERRSQGEVSPVETTIQLPGVVFSSLFDDQDLDEHDWTAEFLKLRDAVRASPR